jgi:hypothetical protein
MADDVPGGDPCDAAKVVHDGLNEDLCEEDSPPDSGRSPSPRACGDGGSVTEDAESGYRSLVLAVPDRSGTDDVSRGNRAI